MAQGEATVGHNAPDPAESGQFLDPRSRSESAVQEKGFGGHEGLFFLGQAVEAQQRLTSRAYAAGFFPLLASSRFLLYKHLGATLCMERTGALPFGGKKKKSERERERKKLYQRYFKIANKKIYQPGIF